MSIGCALKCLFCLVKCSKYLYLMKKAVCITFVALAVITGVGLFSRKDSPLKRLKEML